MASNDYTLGGKKVFKALSSGTRRRILRVLLKGELHISGIAKEIGISVSGVTRHCRILEEKGLIERRKFGRSHVLRIKPEILKNLNQKQEPQEYKFELEEDFLQLIMPSVNFIKVSKLPPREDCDYNMKAIEIKV
jgi:DNA-binding transcriptional ArsR family regulator